MVAIPKEIETLHFIGIGGIGMSGIAEILHTLGYTVQGSDRAEGGNVARLRAAGVRVLTGHDANNILDAQGKLPGAVVYSSAIQPDNPEFAAARARKIPLVRRAEMLAELMRMKSAVAVAGTHGKTTTTSMVGAMLEAGGFDPTVINGGIVHSYGTNVRLGQSPWMVVEADESDGTFTRLPATVAVVTNIDPEHMDHYRDFDGVRAAFRRFVDNVPFYGYAVLCADHPEVQTLIAGISDRRVVTYGFSPQADIRAVNVESTPRGSTYDVICRDSDPIERLYLPMLGSHNVLNSLAAVAIARQMNMTAETIRAALGAFTGVKRRFTCTGVWNGVSIIDDYGHHPVEISAVLKAARMAVSESGGRVIALVQPHRYTRLASLFEGFCTCFHEADSVIVADVYPAGEPPIDGMDKAALAEGIRRHGHRDVQILSGPDALAPMIADLARPGDFVICLGAGDITKWANALPENLEALPRTIEKTA
ncbi:MAG: UDP-N-acetylmuramate--L-alanine ligase [Rhodospirillales bacterium]|nr:UDP-N-acetylmuramate--L-alanine ligase [Rhodospirillales bacterium]